MKCSIKDCFSFVVSFAVLPLALNAANQLLTYTAADTPATLGTGDELTFTYDGDKVTKIVANVAKGDTVYLKGDTLAFGTDATVETASQTSQTSKSQP